MIFFTQRRLGLVRVAGQACIDGLAALVNVGDLGGGRDVGLVAENDKEFVERELVQTGVFKARLIADGKKAKAEGLY